MTTTKTRKKKPAATARKKPGTTGNPDLSRASLRLQQAAVTLMQMYRGAPVEPAASDLATATAAMHFCNVARMLQTTMKTSDQIEACYGIAERLANLSNCPAPR